MTSSSGFSFADVWEAVAARQPHAPALVDGDAVTTWAEFERRANALAIALVQGGLQRHARVALYMRNRPEYLEVLFALFKASLVPVNTNYQYRPDELDHVWSDAGVGCVIFEPEFTDACAHLAATGTTRQWVCLAPRETGSGSDAPSWASSYQEFTSHADELADWTARSGDDPVLLYTGGTTGMPKGVVWRQDDLYRHLERINGRRGPTAAVGGPDGPRSAYCAAPFMHGTGLWFSLPRLSTGASLDTTSSGRFDAERCLDVLSNRQIADVCVAGESFLLPLADRLDAEPQRWDLRGLRQVFSSGAALDATTCQRFLRHAPGAEIINSFGSSEAGAIGRTTIRPGAPGALFLDETSCIVDREGRPIVEGSSEVGQLVATGHTSVGYLRSERSPVHFEIEGRRAVRTGDWARYLTPAGEIELLGRGSSCINSGGEKVFAEEVERAVAATSDVADVVVVGTPDPRLGQVVTAVVVPAPNRTPSLASLSSHVRTGLAPYKAPRRLVLVEEIPRGANGKADRQLVEKIARERLGECSDAPATRRKAAP